MTFDRTIHVLTAVQIALGAVVFIIVLIILALLPKFMIGLLRLYREERVKRRRGFLVSPKRDSENPN